MTNHFVDKDFHSYNLKEIFESLIMCSLCFSSIKSLVILCKDKKILEFSITGNILIGQLIAVAHPLDAVVSHKNVQTPLGNG